MDSAAKAAARLAPLGWNIILVERNPEAIDTARGDHLQPYTAEILDRWGLLDRFMAAGIECQRYDYNLSFHPQPLH